ncbi:MAG: MATE family efflux transporter, partial [Clostridia bacterium]|nr:MATE family efflux transporter [Clostridia bacterium]
MIGSLADPIVGGLYISEDAVSATGLVTPVFTLLCFVSYIIGIGAANKYSMYAGAFEKERAHKVAGTSVTFSVIAGITLALLMYVGEDAFFRYYVTNDTIGAMAREYYEPFVFMALIYPLFWNVYYLVIADGNANLVLVSDTVTALVNAAVSLISVQSVGVKGLAYGTIASVAAGLLV